MPFIGLSYCVWKVNVFGEAAVLTLSKPLLSLNVSLVDCVTDFFGYIYPNNLSISVIQITRAAFGK